MSKKIHVFTDADLDGAGSFLILKILHNDCNITYTVTTEKNLREDILNWNYKNNFSDFDKVYVCDLNLKNSFELVDKDNVHVIDHHGEHAEYIDNYKHATTTIKDYPSTVKLIYDTNEVIKTKINKNIKLLFELVSDYDSYKLKLPYSKDLNKIFWSYTGDRVEKFLRDFEKGFYGFNQYHKNALNIINKRINKFLQEEKFYKGSLTIKGQDYIIIGCFIGIAPNEISQIILDKYDGDIVFLINLKNKAVYLRKNKNCNIHLGKLAEKLMNGGGHDAAAGGNLNETIINLTKRLEQIN